MKCECGAECKTIQEFDEHLSECPVKNLVIELHEQSDVASD